MQNFGHKPKTHGGVATSSLLVHNTVLLLAKSCRREPYHRRFRFRFLGAGCIDTTVAFLEMLHQQSGASRSNP